MNKKIYFTINCLTTGGAERVAYLLCTELQKKQYDVTIVVTHQKRKNANEALLNGDFEYIFLEDELSKAPKIDSYWLMLFARFVGKFNKNKSSILKYYARNFKKIQLLHTIFKKNTEATIVSFLYNAMFCTLLAKCRNQKLIISDRGYPEVFLKSRTDSAFIYEKFSTSDLMVCQSPDAKKWYDENTTVKSVVIFNPIKADLPQPYIGTRKEKIVNFCRISDQKNLILLVEAFARFAEDYPSYELEIIGDVIEEDYADLVNVKITELGLVDKAHIMPSIEDIHSHIHDYAMFVSSSDFEGMSNSMLEAIAIGLPTICTDCPAGGARAVITDHENGILTPVGDVDALYRAMKEVVENPSLAEKLSKNGVKVRETQSAEKIVSQWLGVING